MNQILGHLQFENISGNLMTLFPRSSGVLLHITSLPGPYGVGDLGEFAWRFAVSCRAGHQVRQVLPLSPTIQCTTLQQLRHSPEILLISPTELVADGFQRRRPGGDAELPCSPTGTSRQPPLKRTFLEFGFERSAPQACEEIDEFESCTLQQWWLRDFALFLH